jgi:hypothetical protein
VLGLQVFAFALFGIARAYKRYVDCSRIALSAYGVRESSDSASDCFERGAVPYWGTIGAARSLVLTAVFTTITTGWMLARQFNSSIRVFILLKELTAAAVMALIAPYVTLTVAGAQVCAAAWSLETGVRATAGAH